MGAKIEKYIRDSDGDDKKPMKTTTVNIELRQKKFIDQYNLNLSHIVRDAIETLMRQKRTDDDSLL